MSWQAEYLAALTARDQREQAGKSLIDAYTTLADRTASLTSATTSTASKPDISTDSSRTRPVATAGGSKTALPTTASPNNPTSSSPSKKTASTTATAAGTASRQQADLTSALAAAQARRAALEGTVTALRAEAAELGRREEAARRRAAGLEAERAVLATRLRDRDEELRGKAKLLDDVQNEAVTLNLTLNVTEESNRKLARENRELVDRWMARMGEEAERMNVESKFS